MSVSFLGIFSAVPALIVIIAQWVGVMALRGERTAAWRTMLVGTSIATIGPLISLVALVLIIANRMGASIWPGLGYLGLFGMGAVGLLGNLIFAAGFAVHGLKRRAARERELQLEAITAAMAEELRVLRERVS